MMSHEPKYRTSAHRSIWLTRITLFTALGGLLAGWTLLIKHHQGGPAESTRWPVSVDEFFAFNKIQLRTQDIVALNLLCAQSLPNTTEVDLSTAKNNLDSWAKRVASETARNFHLFHDRPQDFNNSEAYFRMLALVTVLQQDFGVHYNGSRAQALDYKDSRDLFLHGILGAERQGTCLSMPVLYVAIGRRLGYPLKLVATKAHLFARWESADGKEKLNLEGTNQGLNCFSDEYYRTWPVPLTDAEIKEGIYLKSLSPAEELAVFLSARGHCLEANTRYAEAQLAHAQAHVLVPTSPLYLAFLAEAVQRERPDWRNVRVDLGQSKPLVSGNN